MSLLQKYSDLARPASAPAERDLDVFVNVRGNRLQLVLQTPSTDPVTGATIRERVQFVTVKTYDKATPAQLALTARQAQDVFRKDRAALDASFARGVWEKERERASSPSTGGIDLSSL